VNGFLNSVWLRKFNSFSSRIKGSKQSYKYKGQIQHEAARIVTGLPKFASIESLYFETGWEPLHSRRHSRKLKFNSRREKGVCK
jgi:hypothetical protein